MAGGTSNLAGRTESGKSDHSVGVMDGLRKIFRVIWPTKTAVNLACQTGTGVRNAERVLNGERGLSAEALSAILRSERGEPVLQEIMRGSRAKWWRKYRAAGQRAALRQAIDDATRELERLDVEAAKQPV